MRGGRAVFWCRHVAVMSSVVIDREVAVGTHRQNGRREVPFELGLLVAELVAEIDREPTEDSDIHRRREHGRPWKILGPDEVRVPEEGHPENWHQRVGCPALVRIGFELRHDLLGRIVEVLPE